MPSLNSKQQKKVFNKHLLFKKYLFINMGLLVLVLGSFALTYSFIYFQHTNTLSKQNAQIELTEDVLKINSLLISREKACASKNYVILPKIYDDTMHAIVKTKFDTYTYQALLTKDEQLEIDTYSNKINDFITNNEHLLESCSQKAREVLDSNKFEKNLRHTFESVVFSQAKSL